MSEAKFMLCTRLRNDTPGEYVYTIHTISRKCSISKSSSSIISTNNTGKSNRSWYRVFWTCRDEGKTSNNNEHSRRTHILSQRDHRHHTQSLSASTASVSMSSVWVTVTVVSQVIAMIILIQTMMMSEFWGGKAVCLLHEILSILVACIRILDATAAAARMSENTNSNINCSSSIKNHRAT